MRSAAALVAALLALGAAACGGTSSGGSDRADRSKSLEALQVPAEDAGSSRIAMTTKTEGDGVSFTVRTEGTYDYDDERGRAVTMPAGDAAELRPTKMIFDGAFVYVKSHVNEAYGASAKGWARMDLGDALGEVRLMNQDPSRHIDILRSAGAEVDETGAENIDGVRTTHYTAEIAFEDLAAQAEGVPGEESLDELEVLGGEVAPVELEAWIDDEGLPRRISLVVAVVDRDDHPGGEMTMRVRIDLFDYGVHVDVQPPEKFEDISAAIG